MNTEDKDIILFMIIYFSIVIPMFIFSYDFRNFTICFFESSSILYGQYPEYQYCNIEDTDKIWEAISK